MRRLAGQGGDPVVQLQTNFGGGKTHSMLALYHLFSGIAPTELVGIDRVMEEAGAKTLPSARRVVLVGNKISPGNPTTKPDGTVVRTLWGELAWQLGGKKAFARIQADDERATSPGDVLRELFNEYGPSLILIDEWVAYARQLHDQGDLPAGGFETQFTFAQVLTESAKLAKNCLLVISLPASDTSGSPHTQADDVEVGGQRGREALDRLRNVVGRVESSWRPASAEEGFEIVRRRLFEPMTEPRQFTDRDVVARGFADFYRTQHQEFPPECRDSDYEKRIKAAYPIHPEIFDRLYTDWSTLIKFQRTRGVLRLMAAVIHSLWEKGDKTPLILPANIPIDDPRVQFELTRYLSDNWVPTIEKDVDGPGSLPLRLDGEVPNLGKFSACRRVARTIYLGSAPTMSAAHLGLEDRRVKLGCVLPGESPAIFGDALRRLAGAATYLYQDGPRYWYSTQPTVTKLADDRAEQLKREPDKVVHELDQRLRADLRNAGDFSRVHALPQSGQDVPDDLDARLVVLRTDHPYSKERGQCRRGGGPGDLRVARQHAPPLSQRDRLPRGGPDPPPGPRRGGAEVPGVGIDPEREGRAEPHAAAGEAGGDPASRRGQRRHGPHPRGLPLAHRPHAEIAPGGRRVAGVPAPLGARCACRPREQEAQDRRIADHQHGRHDPQDVARSHPALAGQPRRGEAARRGLRPLCLPPASQGERGARRRHSRRPRVVDVGGGELSPSPTASTSWRASTGDCAADSSSPWSMPTRPACS